MSASDLPSPPVEAPSAESPAPAVSKTVTLITAQGRREQRSSDEVRKHDFRHSAFLTHSELRWTRLRHEQYVRALAARLSMCLRMDIMVRLSRLEILNYQQCLEGLASPMHVSLFKAEPLKGVCLLVVPPRLGLIFVDRLLGGPGHTPEANRDLSEIETALLDQVIQIILTEWCNHWQDVQEIKPSLLGHENNSRFLQTAPPDTAMLQITLEAAFDDTVEPMQLLFPYYTIEPFIRHMQPLGMQFTDGAAPGAKEGASRHKWNPELNTVKINITAEWPGLQLTALELARLKAGDVLLMPAQNTNQVQVFLAKTPKFCGRLGTCGPRWAVELTRTLSD
jgi:flagellar motor switch protein FliM